jgi:hypothetical protein
MLLVTLGRRNETLVELDNDDMSVFRSQMSDKTLYHFEGCYEAKLARISYEISEACSFVLFLFGSL